MTMARLRNWLIDILATFFLVTFFFNIGLYESCQFAERHTPLPDVGRTWSFATKYGVCFYSRGESFLLDNFLYLGLATITVAAILIAGITRRRRYDLEKQEFVSEPDFGRPNWIRLASLGLLSVGILAFICWG
jgi:hypothetical protein